MTRRHLIAATCNPVFAVIAVCIAALLIVCIAATEHNRSHGTRGIVPVVVAAFEGASL